MNWRSDRFGGDSTPPTQSSASAEGVHVLLNGTAIAGSNGTKVLHAKDFLHEYATSNQIDLIEVERRSELPVD